MDAHRKQGESGNKCPGGTLSQRQVGRVCTGGDASFAEGPRRILQRQKRNATRRPCRIFGEGLAAGPS